MSGSPTPQQTPTNTTQNINSVPAFLEPNVSALLGAAENQVYQKDASGGITGMQPYVPYSTKGEDYVAGLTPMQQQAATAAGGLQTPEQLAQGTGIASAGAAQSLGAGAAYNAAATDPNSIKSFMSPYQQNVVDWQTQQANRQFDISGQAQQGTATQQGAFGGSREALMAAENERNRNQAITGIQATGAQNAFQQAQAAQQFGATAGLQGASQATTAAGTLGALGTSQLAAQQGIIGTQTQQGSIQQAQQQAAIEAQIANQAKSQAYPMEQLGQMSSMIRGIPTQQTTSVYNAQPTTTSQILTGIGSAASLYGASQAGKAKGGIVGYGIGGSVLKDIYGAVPDVFKRNLKSLSSSSIRSMVADAANVPELKDVQDRGYDVGGAVESDLYDMTKEQLQTVIQQATSETERSMAKRILAEKSMARGGIVAFANAGKVYQEPDWPETSEATSEYEKRRAARLAKNQDFTGRTREQPMNAGQVREQLLARQKLAAEATVPSPTVEPLIEPPISGGKMATAKLAGSTAARTLGIMSLPNVLESLLNEPADKETYDKYDRIKQEKGMKGVFSEIAKVTGESNAAIADKASKLANEYISKPTQTWWSGEEGVKRAEEEKQAALAKQAAPTTPATSIAALPEGMISGPNVPPSMAVTPPPNSVAAVQPIGTVFTDFGGGPQTLTPKQLASLGEGQATPEELARFGGIAQQGQVGQPQQGIIPRTPVDQGQVQTQPTAGIPQAFPTLQPGPYTQYQPAMPQVADQGIGMLEAQTPGLQKAADVTEAEHTKNIIAEREAAGVTDEATKKARSEMMGERANAPAEAERQAYLRAAEFFAHWGSTPGPVISAGLQALTKTMPGYLDDIKDQKKLKRELDKGIYEMDQSDRMDRLGLHKEAAARREKASDAIMEHGNLIAKAYMARDSEERRNQAQVQAASVLAGNNLAVAQTRGAYTGTGLPVSRLNQNVLESQKRSADKALETILKDNSGFPPVDTKSAEYKRYIKAKNLVDTLNNKIQSIPLYDPTSGQILGQQTTEGTNEYPDVEFDAEGNPI